MNHKHFFGYCFLVLEVLIILAIIYVIFRFK